jgi:hypothetical protein
MISSARRVLPTTVPGHVERRAHQRDFVVAADQWRHEMRTSFAGTPECLDGTPRTNGFLLAFGVNRCDLDVANGFERCLARLLAYEHSARIGPGLEPARGVHDVAGCGVVGIGTQGSDERLAGVDPDAHAHGYVDLALEAPHGVLHLERRTHRAFGVVAVGDWRAEQRDDAVTDDLVHVATEAHDVGGEPIEHLVDEDLHALGVERLRQGRESHDVAEQHRDHTALVGAELQHVTARRAETCRGWGQHAARRAVHRSDPRGRGVT